MEVVDDDKMIVQPIVIEESQLQQIDQENGFFMQLYSIFNTQIEKQSGTREAVIHLICSEVPDNLENFCVYVEHNQLMKIKETQNNLETGGN